MGIEFNGQSCIISLPPFLRLSISLMYVNVHDGIEFSKMVVYVNLLNGYIYRNRQKD